MSLDSLGATILDTIRVHLKMSVGQVQVLDQGRQVWRLDATSATGERFTASDEDYYRAACMLAELVGMELEE